jgi:O-antigen/teichoic acid export membrane protein
LLSGPLQARALGPAGRGDLAAITVVGSFLPIVAGLGLEMFVARETARGTPLRDILGTVGIVTVVIALIIVPLGFPISTWLAHGRSTVHFFILIQFLLLPLSLCGQLMYYALVGLERWSTLMLVRMIPIVGPAIVIIVLYVTHSMTIIAVAAATSIAALIALVPASRVVPRLTTLRIRLPLLRSAFPFSLYTWLGTLAVMTNGRIDQLIMVGVTSSRQLGLYAVAVTATLPATQIISGVGSPLLSRIAAGERHLVRQTLRTTVLIVIALDICVAGVTPFALPFLFGNAFREAIPMALILLVAVVPFSATFVLTSAMVADGHPSVPAIGEAMTLFVTIPGLIVFVPSLGGIGAAAVSLVAYSVDAGYQIRAGRRNFGGHLREYVIPGKDDAIWVWQRLLSMVTLLLRRVGEHVHK